MKKETKIKTKTKSETTSEKLGTAELSVTEKGSPIFKIDLLKSEIDRMMESDSKYVNTLIISENANPQNISVVEKKNEGENKITEHSILGSLTLFKDKIAELQEKEGFLNIAAMPKFSKEGKEIETEIGKNEFVAFQSHGEGKTKETVYVGNAKIFTPNSLGLAFKNESDKGYSFINCLLNKNKILLTPVDTDNTMVVGLRKAPALTKKGNEYLIVYPTNKDDKEALAVISLDAEKLRGIKPDEKSTVRITISDKKEQSIKKDGANLNVFESKKQGEDEKETNYVGKGWNNGLDKLKTEKTIEPIEDDLPF